MSSPETLGGAVSRGPSNFPLLRSIVAAEIQEYGGRTWRDGAGGLNDVAFIQGSDQVQDRIVKLPHAHPGAQQCGYAERRMLKLIASKPACPVVVPRLLRESNRPHYFVVSYVPGEVLTMDTRFSAGERAELGRAVARLDLWTRGIDISQFQEEVGQHGYEWNWPAYLRPLDAVDEAKYRNLGRVAAEMRGLRPAALAEYADRQRLQVIHGDVRLPNLTFAGSEQQADRQTFGVFDWGTAQVGTATQDARGLYPFGQEAIDGFNEVLVENGRPPASLEIIRFWHIARNLAMLVSALNPHGGIRSPFWYNTARMHVTAAYPDVDWSELPPIDTAAGAEGWILVGGTTREG